jgi:HMG box factor
VRAVSNLLTPVHPLAFILYRQHYQAAVVAQNPGLANPEISKIIGAQWRKLPQTTKDEWKNLAEVIANQAAVVLHSCSSC